jgi:hypothetical protein
LGVKSTFDSCLKIPKVKRRLDPQIKLGHTVSTDITDAGTPLDPAEERPMQAFIHVVDREGETLHVSRRSLKLEAGHVYYHEIHLRDN